MQIAGIVVNIFFPGIGTLIVGKIGQGIAQIILAIIALILNLTVVLAIIGIPLAIGVWVWGIVSAATPKIEKQRYRE
jgi:TM2 domain-containing membrane protein YozV